MRADISLVGVRLVRALALIEAALIEALLSIYSRLVGVVGLNLGVALVRVVSLLHVWLLAIGWHHDRLLAVGRRHGRLRGIDRWLGWI